MVDGGAPQISAAQAELERLAAHWQGQAQAAAETAAYYTYMAGSLKLIYRRMISEAMDEVRT